MADLLAPIADGQGGAQPATASTTGLAPKPSTERPATFKKVLLVSSITSHSFRPAAPAPSALCDNPSNLGSHLSSCGTYHKTWFCSNDT